MPAEVSLDAAKAALQDHLSNLDAERERTSRALAELEGGPPRRSPGRPRGSKTQRPGKRRRRRGGTRLDQAVEMVKKEPGISAADIAKGMKIKPNYLYRVMDEAVKEGRVRKDGRKYFPA